MKRIKEICGSCPHRAYSKDPKEKDLLFCILWMPRKEEILVENEGDPTLYFENRPVPSKCIRKLEYLVIHDQEYIQAH